LHIPWALTCGVLCRMPAFTANQVADCAQTRLDGSAPLKAWFIPVTTTVLARVLPVDLFVGMVLSRSIIPCMPAVGVRAFGCSCYSTVCVSLSREPRRAARSPVAALACFTPLCPPCGSRALPFTRRLLVCCSGSCVGSQITGHIADLFACGFADDMYGNVR
jgi:hypothetical protein